MIHIYKLRFSFVAHRDMWVVEGGLVRIYSRIRNVQHCALRGADNREPRDEVTTDGIFRKSGVGTGRSRTHKSRAPDHRSCHFTTSFFNMGGRFCFLPWGKKNSD